MSTPLASASDLAIAGYVPLSTIDWPGALCASVFLQGCPWRCVYCQNTELIDPRANGTVTWEEFDAFLQRRQGLLDGVVFSGGEATRQLALAPAIKHTRELGFAIGLHTAGAYPARFAHLLPDVDWVGLDIKALPDGYRPIIGADAGAKAWHCLDLLLAQVAERAGSERPLTYEVRTTIYPNSTVAHDLPRIVEELRTRGVENFALQEARERGTSPQFQKQARSWDLSAWQQTWTQLVAMVENAGFSTVAIRPA
ncbi:anaerobic ribonucleoside-triphosphate reductase activating protein [Arcanobacterium pinnipediorum]|uniref:Anaerobic ribonucleoside-triphosphate reductase activating protein n=1 Tax=Arcanobacterium pinnipediorum TaxID=1503041 RepID=A0ABY5AGI9_9ACTO|nr:anaerobic ribonucleoside-triphosphate reductase activating protein [Arcanobacterium pinnipediorum]USR79307.1 anaerobic ribonucleoside-triphosphate reductase activating protein [Arcanobacterium pinnipediorum]